MLLQSSFEVVNQNALGLLEGIGHGNKVALLTEHLNPPLLILAETATARLEFQVKRMPDAAGDGKDQIGHTALHSFPLHCDCRSCAAVSAIRDGIEQPKLRVLLFNELRPLNQGGLLGVLRWDEPVLVQLECLHS